MMIIVVLRCWLGAEQACCKFPLEHFLYTLSIQLAFSRWHLHPVETWARGSSLIWQMWTVSICAWFTMIWSVGWLQGVIWWILCVHWSVRDTLNVHRMHWSVRDTLNVHRMHWSVRDTLNVHRMHWSVWKCASVTARLKQKWPRERERVS